MSNIEYSPPHEGEILQSLSLTVVLDEFEGNRVNFRVEPDELSRATIHLTGYEMADLGASLAQLAIRALAVRLSCDWIPESLEAAAALRQKLRDEGKLPLEPNQSLVPVGEVAVH